MKQVRAPAVDTAMLIRKPATEVFEAFADPAITTRFWFTHASDRLAPGRKVTWEWSMHGASADVKVTAYEPPQRLAIEWESKQGSTNTVEWTFTQRPDGTLVSIRETGYNPDDPEVAAQVAESTSGFSLVLAGLKAYLEHGIQLNLVADRWPDGPPQD